MISIRHRLMRELLGVSLVLLSGGLVAVYFAARSEIVEQFDLALRARALAISTLTRLSGDSLHLEFHDRFFPGFEERKPRDFFELWGADDRPVARSESLGSADLPLNVGTVDHPKVWDFTLPNGRAARAMGFAFQPRGDGPGDRAMPPAAARLVVATDSEDLAEALMELSGVVASWGALLVVAIVWTIPRVLRRGLRPLDSLGEQVARIDAESLAARFERARLPAELQPIAQRLNDLLERLEQSFDRERRVNADLAHELRTPVAELRVLAESALKWPDARDPSTDEDALGIAEQMESIVERMLALARSEQGRIELAPGLLDAAAFVANAWRSFAARAEKSGLPATFDLASAAIVADPALLRSILSNLFDNAIEHTARGGAIHLACGREPDGGVFIRVTNTAKNLEPADVPRLFERFWRKETARTSGTHLGLGLALVRSFTQTLGWKIDATMDDEHRLSMTLHAKDPAGDAHHLPIIQGTLDSAD